MSISIITRYQQYLQRIFTKEDLLIAAIVMAVVLLLPMILCVLHFKPLVRTVAVIVFVVYIFGNLSYTIFGREELSSYYVVLPTFGQYHNAVYLDLGIMGTIRSVWQNGLQETLRHIHLLSASAAREVLLNILLYVPMGYLLPFILKPMRYSVMACTVVGLLCSCATEFAQLYYHIGYFQVDDIINNTLGCFIGAVFGCLLARLWKTK